MKILFMGTPDFAVPSLRALVASDHEVVAVATGCDKQRGRGRRMSPTPVKAAALEAGLPVIETDNVRDPAFAEALGGFPADLYVIVAFRILPASVFTIPPKGTFNLHASLLPKYRGAAPINWALMNGDTRSGVTTFMIREQVDTGGILLQDAVQMPASMTAGELHDVLAASGAALVVRTVSELEAGVLAPQPQNDSEATPAPKIFRDTCRIDWSRSAAAVHNHVRGLSPHPGAWTMLGDTILKLHGTRVAIVRRGEVPVTAAEHGLVPGTMLRDRDHIGVVCGENILDILTLQPEGRRAMTTEEFLRGHDIPAGTVLV